MNLLYLENLTMGSMQQRGTISQSTLNIKSVRTGLRKQAKF